ncbi:MAG: signal peptide peptidase SppA [Candidatus Binataceae bacterium]
MLRRLFRWLLRTIASLIVLLVIVAVYDYFAHRVAPNSVLVVTLDGPVIERGRTGITGLLGGAGQTPLNLVREALERAAGDPRIVGVALKVGEPEMEFAQAQEIVAMLGRFARHGKWTAAYLETAGEFEPGNLPYVTAAAAREVSMMPLGELNLVGVGVREIFARGALDWLGIRPNFDSIGQYKSAANVFTEKDFTPAQREEDQALVSDLYDQLLGQIASERQLDLESVRAIVERAPLSAQDGLAVHLVDRLEYADQFDERLKHYGGQKHALIDYAAYVRPRVIPVRSEPLKIAVIYGEGEIQRGSGGFDPIFGTGGPSMASDSIVEAFKTAGEDVSVKAVIFRINSPGGSVIGSELIRRAVELTADKKPVVVSMSGYAASGGYWVATPGKRIFADPGTITGSIGVLIGKFNVMPAAQKLGVNSGAITRGQNFEMFDQFEDFTPAQQKIIHEQLLGDTYQRFVKLVADSRHLSVAQVDQVAQGRVWTGAQAYKAKLVDQLGGFDNALEAAKAEAKIPPTTPVGLIELPAQPSLLEQLLQGGLDGSLRLGVGARELRPWMWLARIARAQSASFDAAYCTLVPVM